MKSKIGRIGLAVGILALGGGAYAAYQHDMFPIHHAIDVPPSFDNKAESQIIRLEANTITVSQDELSALAEDSIKPVIKGENPSVPIFLPIKLNEPQDIKESKIYIKGVNWMTGKLEDTIRGKRFTIPQKDTEIIIPVDNAEVFQLAPYSERKMDGSVGPSYFIGALIRFKGSDQTLYELLIKSEIDVRDMIPIDILKNAPLIGDNGFYLVGSNLNPEKGLSLPIGTAIIKTAKDNANIDVSIGILANKVTNLKDIDTRSVIRTNEPLAKLL